MTINGTKAYGNFPDSFFFFLSFPHFLNEALTTPFQAQAILHENFRYHIGRPQAPLKTPFLVFFFRGADLLVGR